MSRVLRLLLAVVISVESLLLTLAPVATARAQAAESGPNTIAAGLRSFADVLTGIDDIGPLGAVVPLTTARVGDEDMLRLDRVFVESLGGIGASASYTTYAELEAAIGALTGDYGGVSLTVTDLSVATGGSVTDVSFVLGLNRVVAPPVRVAWDELSLDGGALPLQVSASLPLHFQYDAGVSAYQRAFSLTGATSLVLTVTNAGDPPPFEDVLGLLEVVVSPSAHVAQTLQVALLDPDGNGRLTQEEWSTTSILDLTAIGFVAGSGADGSFALDAKPVGGIDLLAGVPDGTVTFLDDSTDGEEAQVTASLNQLSRFLTVSPDDALAGLAQFATAISAVQHSTDLQLPFLDSYFSDSFEASESLESMVKQQGDGLILCGTTDGLPPSGEISGLPVGTTVYCRAVALQDAQTAQWSVQGAELVSGSDNPATVGPNPTVSAELVATGADEPVVSVAFTDPSDVSHEVRPRFQSLQELHRDLTEAGFAVTPAYDQATASVVFALSAQGTPEPMTARLEFSDQLKPDTGITDLGSPEGVTVTVQPSGSAVQAAFGMILVDDPAAIDPDDNADSEPNLGDRFFFGANPSGPELQFGSVSVGSPGPWALAGNLGPLEIVGSAVEYSLASGGGPALAVDVAADGIPLAGGLTVPNAVGLESLLTGTEPLVTRSVDLTAAVTMYLQSPAGADGQLGAGTVGVSWPSVGTGLPQVSTDEYFRTSLQVFDVSPSRFGVATQESLPATEAEPRVGLLDGGALFGPELVGRELRNLTDGSRCLITSLEEAGLVCEDGLTGGLDNGWQIGDRYEIEGDPSALVGVALGRLNELAAQMAALPTSGVDALHAYNSPLPVAGLSPRSLVGSFAVLQSALSDVQAGLNTSGADVVEIGAPLTLQDAKRKLDERLAGTGVLALGQGSGPAGTELNLSLSHNVCTTGNAGCVAGAAEVAGKDLTLQLDLGLAGSGAANPPLTGTEPLAGLLEYSTATSLSLGLALADPALSATVHDSTGVMVNASLAAAGLSYSASAGPLLLTVGTGAALGGVHDGDASPTLDSESHPTGPTVLTDSTRDFAQLGDLVGRTITNTTTGGACGIESVTATAITCAGALLGGKRGSDPAVDDAYWQPGDGYRVEGVGNASLTAAAVLSATGGSLTVGDPDQFVSGLASSRSGSASAAIAVQDQANSAFLGFLSLEQPDINMPGTVTAPVGLTAGLVAQPLNLTQLPVALAELQKAVETSLNGSDSGLMLPLIGPRLDGGSGLAATVQTGLVTPLAGLGQAATAATAGELKTQLADSVRALIGPDGTGLLLGSDVVVTALCDDAVCQDGDDVSLINDLRISFPAGSVSVPVKGCSGEGCLAGETPFDIGLPGLALYSDATVGTSYGWRLQVDFGLSRNQGPYLGVGEAGAAADLAVGLSAALKDAPNGGTCSSESEDPLTGEAWQVPALQPFSETRCFAGQIGILPVTFRDAREPTSIPVSGGGTRDIAPAFMTALVSVDLLPGEGGDRIAYSALLNHVGSEVALDADANLDLRFRTGFREGAASAFPSVMGTFHLTWLAGATAPDGNPEPITELAFDSLYMDAGPFFGKFVTPIAQQARKVTSPLQPVIDTLVAPLPVVSDLSRLGGGGPVSLLTLAELAGANTTMISRLIGFVQFVNTIPAGTGLIPLGGSDDESGQFDVNVLLARAHPGLSVGTPAATYTNPIRSAVDTVERRAAREAQRQVDPNATPEEQDQQRRMQQRAQRTQNAARMVKNSRAGKRLLSNRKVIANAGFETPPGISFPFLEDSSQIFYALLGQDVTLVRLDFGTVAATVGFYYRFRIQAGPVPVALLIGGSATIRGRFAMGYDTRGFGPLLTGAVDPSEYRLENLLDGIFIDDLDADGVDVPEFQLTMEVTAGAAVDLVFIAVGVEGGIYGVVNFDLRNDIAENGKLRIAAVRENLHNPICLFTISGRVEAFLRLFFEINFFLFKKRFNWEPFPRWVLFSFSYQCAPPIPNLASVVDGNLRLHMGPYAGSRGIFKDEIDERFVVRQLDSAGTRFSVAAFDTYEEYGGVTGVVLAEGGSGDDSMSFLAGIDPQTRTPVPFTRAIHADGGAGKDSITGGQGNDQLAGGPGNDRLVGAEGDDTLYGGDGDDVLDGGFGNDYLYGEAGNDNINGGPGSDHLDGGWGDDSLDGGPGAEYAEDPATMDLADTLIGGPGSDQLSGHFGNDTLFGDGWVDCSDEALCAAYTGSADDGDDQLSGGGGDDILVGGGGSDSLSGGPGNDYCYGSAGNDTLEGDDADADQGDDVLYGGIGDDDIFGRGGADRLHGGDGNDAVSGGRGVDEVYGDGGDDYLFGDEASWTRVDGRREFAVVDETIGESDTIWGGDGNDTAYGQGGGDAVNGQAGDDSLFGGDGADTLWGDTGADSIRGGAGADTIWGGDGADSLFGDSDDDLMYGEAGADYMRGGLGLDLMYGGDDDDEMHGDAGADRMWGQAGDDVMRGHAGDDYLEGNSGADTIYGGDDQDDIIGGTSTAGAPDGGDRLYGGNGEGAAPNDCDAIIGDNGVISREAGAAGQWPFAGYAGSVARAIVLFDIDSLDPSLSGPDTIAGEADCDVIYGQGGDDLVSGGPGDDYIEGNAGNDSLYGDDGQDDLVGGSAPLDLGDGADQIWGGAGADVILGDNGSIVRAVTGGEWVRLPAPADGGFDLVVRTVSMAQSPTEAGTFGNDTLSGDDGHDEIYGQLGSDYITGGGGDDVAVGDLGQVTTRYEDGSQAKTVSTKSPFISVIVYQAESLTRSVTLYSYLSGAGSAAGDDVILGGEGRDSLHGGAGADILNGNAGDDAVFGGDDSDALWGGHGRDRLYGGYGGDYLDVVPREGDPETWRKYAGVENFQGVDIAYGGWGRDALQADVGSGGPVEGDRLLDWVGAYNVFYVCDGAYGAGVILRGHSPQVQALLQTLAEADGALTPAKAGTSGYQELAMVFAKDSSKNSHPPHPDHPGHFTCPASLQGMGGLGGANRLYVPQVIVGQ